jgi:hypothetical protein
MPKEHNWAIYVDGHPFIVTIKSLSNHDVEDENHATRTMQSAEKAYRQVYNIVRHGLDCKSCIECPDRQLEALARLSDRMMP